MAIKPANKRSAVEAFLGAAPDSQSLAESPNRRGVRRGRREQITLTLPPGVLASIDARAKQLGISRAAFIVQSAVRALEKEP